MRTKVGITLEESLHKRAKTYAKETGRTLSGLIEVSLKHEIQKKSLKNGDDIAKN